MINKSTIWQYWIAETVLHNIRESDTPDPVPFFETMDGKLETS
ncbi:hypothetical protein SAMN05421858_4346 [Haladaptatus litoreus]|uniref:Uncharacterized protein n=1 Tax=Haladaptatus litoreus TaxID=553468 RepID=A0A1N7EKR8_9EURY|nr:hypothetical protein SAMN05421858_4346 [Haladaptatus litoreus]